MLKHADKAKLHDLADYFGEEYGVFFTTSGACHYERINPNARYEYIWRTGVKNNKGINKKGMG